MSTMAGRRAMAPNGVLVDFIHLTDARFPYSGPGWWLTVKTPGKGRYITTARIALGPVLDARQAGEALAEVAGQLGDLSFDPASLAPVTVYDTGDGWRFGCGIPRFGTDPSDN